MQHVRQREQRDCGIAALAMVAGISYEEAQSAFAPAYEPKRTGLIAADLYAALAELGFATQELHWPRWGGPIKHAGAWPPKPFAPAHLAQLYNAGSGGHFIAMDESGTAYDPARPGPRTLGDYTEIWTVAGIWPARRPP